MTPQEATMTVSNLLESARTAIESAMSLGKEYGIPVNLNKIGGSIDASDMWYVAEEEHRQEYIRDNFLEYDVTSGNYIQRELTEEEKKEIEEYMQNLRDCGGYDSYGTKVLGWMSSSTNC
jgi:hypothetical protein